MKDKYRRKLLKCMLLNVLLTLVISTTVYAQQVEGQVTVEGTGEELIGLNIIVKGTNVGTSTNLDGSFQLTVPSLSDTLVFSYLGYETQEVPIANRSEINVTMIPSALSTEDLVVIGYGTQQRSDITGSVASVPRERLEKAPNLNLAQAIQGAIPGVMVSQTSAGASPNESLMVRGRNSITANNSPLVVIDGIPGAIGDVNPNDVQSIEVLKDASAAAIYGSRGANGVILITTKDGLDGETRISYNGYYSTQRFANIPDLMNGEEFYNYKQVRDPGAIRSGEQQMYEAGEWTDWMDLALRNGASQQHNLSVSGGFNNTTYYLSGGLMDVQGIAVNDDYMRATSRINVDTKVADWFTIGTRTQLTYADRSGVSPGLGGVFHHSPLSRSHDDDGNLTIYPQSWDQLANPLQGTLYNNIDKSQQIVTNNYAIADFPFIEGLSYRLNTGIRLSFADRGTYRGMNTASGYQAHGSANTNRSRGNNTVIENILSYDQKVGAHGFSTTAIYSFEENSSSSNTTNANGFPNDYLTWYATEQADFAQSNYNFEDTHLISQMLRLNYVYDQRYMLTFTGRRDGFSGFGDENKWGVFPSIAIGWNLANEQFFPWGNAFNELKPRISWGLNGNQAVGAYQTISRAVNADIVSLKQPLPGYRPGTLAVDNLGWESSETLNAGLDFGIYDDRISGDINVYRTNTTDLLLNRNISDVHGISSIVQNIGETKNRGIEFSLHSRNIVTSNFMWVTSGNIANVRNEIVDLYGDGLDDPSNNWFIGQPIRVNYDFVWEGTWQLDEAEEAAVYESQPGFVKVKDVNGDGNLTGEDRQIIGQQDPKVLWGLTNSFSYKNFNLDVFIHGVHGVTKYNDMKRDNHLEEVRDATTNKNWWTPDNPTNDWIMNDYNARIAAGNVMLRYENASFIRVKDVSLSYDLPQGFLDRAGLNQLRLYVTGRNLLTFTGWEGLDPELDSQNTTPTRGQGFGGIPLQKEFVIGLDFGF
ncbi:MAG: TonB-dependent receptor [Balneolales bacterium]